MKPSAVSGPSRIFRRGCNLRRSFEEDEQQYYVSRLYEPELENNRLFRFLRRTISNRTGDRNSSNR